LRGDVAAARENVFDVELRVAVARRKLALLESRKETFPLGALIPKPVTVLLSV
jgi:hypothetical protein